MSDTITPEAAAVLAALERQSVVGPAFGSRLAARQAAWSAGFRLFSYGKRRHVAVDPDGKLFYLGGPEEASVWVAMTTVSFTEPDAIVEPPV
jgi:hypothetical protein